MVWLKRSERYAVACQVAGLNSIENMWEWLARKMYKKKRQFMDVGELEKFVMGLWEQTSARLIESCLGPMHDRPVAVLVAQRGHTKCWDRYWSTFFGPKRMSMQWRYSYKHPWFPLTSTRTFFKLCKQINLEHLNIFYAKELGSGIYIALGTVKNPIFVRNGVAPYLQAAL